MKRRQKGEKITWIVLYDWSTAKLADRVGVDMILVGDSVGMTMLGYPSTVPVTMTEMLHHINAVLRGTKYAFVVGDMPFLSYQTSMEDAIRNAGTFMKAGCDAIKMEGGSEIAGIVKVIVEIGIPVIGHLGLTPQRASMSGRYKVHGSDAASAMKIVEDAKAFEKAGAFGVLLENIPAEVGKIVTEEASSLMTFGIGGGPYCHGQLLLSYDILGLTLGVKPLFAKNYVNLSDQILEAFRKYCNEVKNGEYPSEEYNIHMKNGEHEKLIKLLKLQKNAPSK